MSVLDLSELEGEPQKVKLPDGQLYDMADPNNLGPLPLQRLLSRYRRSQEIMANTEASPAEAEEMMDLLVDVAEVLLPGAPREVVGSLPVPKITRLVEAFFAASPVGQAATVEAPTTTPSVTPTSAS